MGPETFHESRGDIPRVLSILGDAGMLLGVVQLGLEPVVDMHRDYLEAIDGVVAAVRVASSDDVASFFGIHADVSVPFLGAFLRDPRGAGVLGVSGPSTVSVSFSVLIMSEVHSLRGRPASGLECGHIIGVAALWRWGGNWSRALILFRVRIIVLVRTTVPVVSKVKFAVRVLDVMRLYIRVSSISPQLAYRLHLLLVRASTVRMV